MSLETHSTRVAMLKALGADQVTINGDQTVWGLLDQIPGNIDFIDSKIYGQAITLVISEDDADGVYAGSLISINSKQYKVVDEPDNDNGMCVLLLQKAH